MVNVMPNLNKPFVLHLCPATEAQLEDSKPDDSIRKLAEEFGCDFEALTEKSGIYNEWVTDLVQNLGRESRRGRPVMVWISWRRVDASLREILTNSSCLLYFAS